MVPKPLQKPYPPVFQPFASSENSIRWCAKEGVTAFLENFFAKLVEYGFTAGLEEKLDEISAGSLNWKDVLREFWIDFTRQTDDIKDLRVSEVLDALNESLKDHIFPAKADGSDPRHCPNCGEGQLSLKLGKFGAFIGCSNYPECR